MLDLIKKTGNLWKNNKLIFFLILPIALLGLIFKLYSEYQTAKAKESLNDTEEESLKIDKEREEVQKAAEEAKAEAEALKKKREEREAKDVDEDWHKNTD